MSGMSLILFQRMVNTYIITSVGYGRSVKHVKMNIVQQKHYKGHCHWVTFTSQYLYDTIPISISSLLTSYDRLFLTMLFDFNNNTIHGLLNCNNTTALPSKFMYTKWRGIENLICDTVNKVSAIGHNVAIWLLAWHSFRHHKYYVLCLCVWVLWNIHTNVVISSQMLLMSSKSKRFILRIQASFFNLALSDSASDCMPRCPWLEYCTGLTWIYQSTRNESPRLHATKVWIGTQRGLCLCKLDISERRMLTAHKTGSEIVYPGKPDR